jgi:hypothetical protein
MPFGRGGSTVERASGSSRVRLSQGRRAPIRAKDTPNQKISLLPPSGISYRDRQSTPKVPTCQEWQETNANRPNTSSRMSTTTTTTCPGCSASAPPCRVRVYFENDFEIVFLGAASAPLAKRAKKAAELLAKEVHLKTLCLLEQTTFTCRHGNTWNQSVYGGEHAYDDQMYQNDIFARSNGRLSEEPYYGPLMVLIARYGDPKYCPNAFLQEVRNQMVSIEPQIVLEDCSDFTGESDDDNNDNLEDESSSTGSRSESSFDSTSTRSDDCEMTSEDVL